MKNFLIRHLNIYRIIAISGFVIATALALGIRVQMSDPDDWAYYYGVENFAQGHLTVDSQTHTEQVREAQRQGGQLIQYYNIENNKWALEKAPGYVLYLVPFQLLGIPRFGNVLPALGMILVTYVLLKRLRDEKTAMIGSLLMLFTPMSLVMLNRTYMDTYASMSFLVIGGGLYIYYHLEKNKVSTIKGGILLFLACFFTGWSVFTRYTNLPVGLVLFLHLAISRLISWRKKEKTNIRREAIAVLMGVGLPAATLLLYNGIVFGSPLDYGYNYTRFPIKFAFQYLGQVSRNGQSLPLQIILNNLKSAPRALLLGFPLLIIGIPGFLAVLFFKVKALFRGKTTTGRWTSLHHEISWGLLFMLAGWFVSVFGLYLTYEWTADFQGAGAFVIFDRFYLPGLFPVAVIGALVLARFPNWLFIVVLLLLAAFGSVLYAQWALNLNILPAWLINGGRGGRFPGFRPGNLPNNGPPGSNSGWGYGNFPGFNPGQGGQPGGLVPNSQN
jgi:4-amino-4-deoxy-L-arabinose transferase-like glycosyltransferase